MNQIEKTKIEVLADSIKVLSLAQATNTEMIYDHRVFLLKMMLVLSISSFISIASLLFLIWKIL
ncbi:MAG: hypothetical protein ACRCS8_00105 [Brevinema sp.]